MEMIQVIRSCNLILKQKSLKSIMIELDKSDRNYNEILNILDSYGFEVDKTYEYLTKASAKRSYHRFNHFFLKSESFR